MSKTKNLVKFIAALLLILVLGGANLSCPAVVVTIGPEGEISVDFALKSSDQLPTIDLPTIDSFDASPSNITLGNTATIEWNVSGATEVSIDQGIGSAIPAGSVTVLPTATTTYTLMATNTAGTVSQSVTVAVTTPPPPTSPPPTSPPPTSPPPTLPPPTLPPPTSPPPTSPPPTSPPPTSPVIISFTATPSSISLGGSSTLSWNVTGVMSVTISPGSGALPPSGNATVSPAATTTYTLTATNAAGTVTWPATVTVGAAPPPPSGDAATCEQALFDAVNTLRASDGKAALTRNAYIDGLCRQHAQYMATANALSHAGFLDVRGPAIMASIPSMHVCAENVLQDNLPCDANAMAQLWFNSPGHNANMLNAAYNISGMGIEIDGGGKIWACQLFAGP